MGIVSTIAKGTVWMFISALIVKLSGWVYYIILARTVSVNEIGMFYLVFSAISMVIIFSDLGLGSGAVIRYVPYYAGKKQFNHLREVVKTSVSVGSVFSLICASIVLFYSKQFSLFFKNEGLAPIVSLMASYLIVSTFYTISLSFLQGRKKLKLSSYVNSTQGIGKLVFTTIMILVFGFNAISITLGFILSFIFASFLGLYWSYKEYQSLPSSDDLVQRFSLLKEMIPFGLTAIAINSVWSVITSTDRLLLGYLLPVGRGTELIGVYSIVVGFSGLMTVFAVAVNSITLPLVSESYGKGNKAEIEETVKTALRWIALVTVPPLLFVLLFPEQILGMIYGKVYAQGYLTLAVYALGTFLLSFAYPSQNVLEAMRRLDVTVRIFVIGALLNAGLNYLLIPQYDINGAALASAVTYLVVMVLLFSASKRFVNVGFPKISKIAISGAITVVAMLLAKSYMIDAADDIMGALSGSEVLGKVAGVLILGVFAMMTAAIYFAVLILLRGFIKEDVDILAGAMRRMNAPDSWIIAAQRILLD